MPRLPAQGTVLPVSGNGTVNDVGFYLFEGFIVEAKFRHDTGTKLLYQDIIIGNELMDDLNSAGVLEIQGHTALAPLHIGYGK